MKNKELISKMTLEEKAAFLSGKNEWQTWDFPRLSIPSLFLSDGPNGVRRQDGAGDHLGLNPSLPATCFPSAATIANSWDPALGKEIGRALGEEARSLGVNVLLGPGLNIKRNPLCGRNFEYFSEDPYLAGKMAAAYISGIQENHVAACPKHFAVNSQELRRMAMNAVLDERTMREIYLTGFEIAVKEGKPKAIMSSYNEINGTYANENRHLLKDILRNEWKYDGFVVTDWGGSNDHVQGVKAGSDLEMPSPGLDSARILLKGLEEGKITEQEIDECVDRLLTAVLDLTGLDQPDHMDEENHHRLAKKAASESLVLLKNEYNILPLTEEKRVAVIGKFAESPRFQGSGSSQVNPTRVDRVMDLLTQYPVNVIGFEEGYEATGQETADAGNKKEKALELAKKADLVLYFFGLDDSTETEGLDRTHMRIPDQQILLLQELSEVNDNIVGILSGGSPIEMEWEKNCKAILHGYMCGQAGAGAILDALTGRTNPSGKLAETYPFQYWDTPSYQYYPSRERNSEYREGIYVGYRYYDTAGVPVRYPFGYGLSYTTFDYSNLQVFRDHVEFTLENTGKTDGTEIAQLYIGLDNPKVFRPKKELKGFARVVLKAGESQKVAIPFDEMTFRYWNRRTNRWEAEAGTYKIWIGASETDLRLAGCFEISGDTDPFGNLCTEELPYDRKRIPSYYNGKIQTVGNEEYRELLGGQIPDGTWSGELGIDDALCQMYYAKSRIARLAARILRRKAAKNEKKGKPDLNILFIYNLPFRAMAKMTEGMVSMEMVEGIVKIVNGHFFRGIGQVIAGFFRNRRENRQYRRSLTAGAGKEAET